jgi:signal transduction histidine kinase
VAWLRRLLAGGWIHRPVSADLLLIGMLVGTSVVWGAPMLSNPKVRLVFGAGWDTAIAEWWTVTAVALAALAVRRRYPILVCVVTGCAALVHMDRGWGPLPADAAVLAAVYAVVTHRRTAVSVAAGVALLGVALGWSGYVDAASTTASEVAAFKGSAPVKTSQEAALAKKNAALAKEAELGWSLPPTDWGGFRVLALTVVLAWAGGQGARQRRAYLEAALARARDLERDQARQAELAAADERARISRELHDVVAHGLSVMVIQAQGASAALDDEPQRSRQALAAIVGTGRQSLTEIRRLLDVLRDPDCDGSGWQPQPDVAQLPALVDRLRRAGLPVHLAVAGTPVPVPAAVGVSAYRIVQEALTNVMKHAGPAPAATVRLDYRPGLLVVEVADDGVGPTGPAPGGHGLVGMRERVTVLGGRLDTGHRPGGGFLVRARLPLAAPAS